MNTDFQTFIKVVMSLIFLVSFVLSVRMFIKIKNAPLLLRGFFFYNLAVVIELILVWFSMFGFINKDLYYSYHLVAITFNFLYLSLFIITCIQIKKLAKVIYLVAFSFFLLTIVSIIPEFKHYTGKASILPHLGLLIFCIVYFYQFFQDDISNDLEFGTSFWIITGIFCCSVLIIPLMLIKDFLKQSLSTRLYLSVSIIGGLGYTIMHSFFIKGFLCSTRKSI